MPFCLRLLSRRIRSLTGQKLGGLFFLWARRAAPFRISSCFSHTFAGPLLPRKLQRSARGDAVAFAPAANGCRRGQLCFPPEFFEPQTSRFVVTWCPFPACLNASACQESGQPDQEAWWLLLPLAYEDLASYVTTCFPVRSSFLSV